MNNYVPQKQDIVWINFNPSLGREIQKRRPALVVSSNQYNKQTGFIAVCPITHGQAKLKEKGLLVAVDDAKVDSYVNPFQLHTFDYRARQAEKITVLDDYAFAQVVQLYNFIFD